MNQCYQNEKFRCTFVTRTLGHPDGIVIDCTNDVLKIVAERDALARKRETEIRGAADAKASRTVKNFEMCSTPVMAALVANFMRRVPMGEDMMMAEGLKFAYEDYDPDSIKWKMFRESTRKYLSKTPNWTEDSSMLRLWKEQHEDLFAEWFGDVANGGKA